MKIKVAILLLFCLQAIYTQKKDSVTNNCIIPVNSQMPQFQGGCDSLINYFNAYFGYNEIVVHHHQPKILSAANCQLDTSGVISHIEMFSNNPTYNKDIIASLNKMRGWDVSRLKDNEYYALTFLFRFKYEFSLSVTINWEIKTQ